MGIKDETVIPCILKSCVVIEDDSRTNPAITMFPLELMLAIFSQIDDAKLLSACSRTCRLWKAIMSDNVMWKDICKFRKYEPLRVARTKDEQLTTSWKHIYKNNFVTRKNWTDGKYTMDNIYNNLHSGYICMDFNEQSAYSIKHGGLSRFWDLKTGISHATFDNRDVASVKFDEHCIITGHANGCISVWDIVDKVWIDGFEDRHNDEIGCIYLNKLMFATGSEDHSIKVWNRHTRRCILTLNGHNGAICALQMNSIFLASASTDATIKIWSLKTGRCVKTLRGHEGTVFCVSFDKKYLCSGGNDARIIIWELDSGKAIRKLLGHMCAVVSLQFDDTKIVSGSADKTIKVEMKLIRYGIYSAGNVYIR